MALDAVISQRVQHDSDTGVQRRQGFSFVEGGDDDGQTFGRHIDSVTGNAVSRT